MSFALIGAAYAVYCLLTFKTVNDRSTLKYQLLLGRDFLEDDFVVDVSLDNPDLP